MPSRIPKTPGLNYEPPEYAAVIAENATDNRVTARMFGMVGGKYTQVEVTYRGKPTVLVLSNPLPSNDPEDILGVVLAFYKYVDLEATSLLKKTVSTHDKPAPTTVERKRKVVVPDNINPADVGLTHVDTVNDIRIYKERLIQIFEYARRRAKDETIDADARSLITVIDVVENVFTSDVYPGLSPITLRGRAGAHIKYMADHGWIQFARNIRRNRRAYTIVTNPYLDEMPAQAEPIDQGFVRESTLAALKMHRDG